MKEDLTDITIVLDRSGSMNKIKSDTIGGFNEFLGDQKEVEGEANFSLIQFDDEYKLVHNALPIKVVPLLNGRTFVPRGMTRLLDAIGRTIVTTGDRLSLIKEEDRPGKVMFVIITDGKENDSREYIDKATIFNMIEHQKNAYNWEFIFLGAKQDAIAVAQGIGISAGQAMRYGHTGDGVKGAFASMARGMTATRTGSRGISQDYFSSEDREKQESEIENENTP